MKKKKAGSSWERARLCEGKGEAFCKGDVSVT